MKKMKKMKNDELFIKKIIFSDEENQIKESNTEMLELKWGKDNSDIKYYMRGGKTILGCGWCGHNNPEG